MELHLAPPGFSCPSCGARGKARLSTRPRNRAVIILVPLALAIAVPAAAFIAVLLFFAGLTWTLLNTRPTRPRCGNRV